MLDNMQKLTRFNKNNLRRVLFLSTILLLLSFANTNIHAQFNSGSTGADGAFNPTVNTNLQIPESGVFNFTTVNIPQNILVTFIRNSRNTPVTILATGNVTIGGRIFLDGIAGNGRLGGLGGPGGFKGGDGGTFIDLINGTAGDGPGGGSGGIGGTTGGGGGGSAGFLVNGDTGGISGNGIGGSGGNRYGTKTLIPLIGGSGGGGGSSYSGSQLISGGGGGGGGAILIASSGSIIFPANSDTTRGIYSRGGWGENAVTNADGGGGSGGAVRLVANTVSGSPCIDVGGGYNYSVGNYTSSGMIRVEAFDLSQYVLRCSTFSQSLGNPNPVTLTNTPTLRITSVGGISAPANPVGSSSSVNPDITVPTSVPNPVQVAIQASNIPTGTVVQIRLTPESGTPTVVNSTPLSGSTSSSTASASVTLPATGISVIRAFVTLDVVSAGLSKVLVEGEKIKQVEIGSSFGSSPEITYVLESGRRVSNLK